VRVADAQVIHLEPWLDQSQLAELLSCSTRWVRYRDEEGMPGSTIAGRRKYRLSEIKPWLIQRGHWIEGKAS
jgi:hypothetical protein